MVAPPAGLRHGFRADRPLEADPPVRVVVPLIWPDACTRLSSTYSGFNTESGRTDFSNWPAAWRGTQINARSPPSVIRIRTSPVRGKVVVLCASGNWEIPASMYSTRTPSQLLAGLQIKCIFEPDVYSMPSGCRIRAGRLRHNAWRDPHPPVLPTGLRRCLTFARPYLNLHVEA